MSTDPLANFRVEVAKREEAPEILEFLSSEFLYNEPLCVAIGLSRTDCAEFFAEIVQNSIADGLSYLVRDPANGGCLAAIRLANVMRRTEGTMPSNGVANGTEHFGEQWPHKKQSNGGLPSHECQYIQQNDKVHKIYAILNMAESKIWSLIPPTINTLLCWLIISVGTNYRRQGIAKALLLHRLDNAVDLGCQGVFTEASALNSQKLFSKLGYDRLFEVLHKDFQDELGNPVFHCADGTDRVTLEFKQF